MLSPKRCVIIDNFIFTLHYRWTVLILISVSFVITCRLLVGNSFTCSTPGNGRLSQNFVDHYCYSNGTFIDLSYWNSSGKQAPYRGIGRSEEYSNRRYIAFYKWVNLILLLQASYFFLPHLIWMTSEKGLTSQLTANMGLHMGEEERGLSLCIMAKYLVMMQGKQTLYAYVYIFCEFLNHLVALAQIVCTVSFFQITGVPDRHSGVILETWADFEGFYFPPVSQCLLYHYDYGVKGFMETEALCSLPLNNLYMRTFLFLYAWYIFLAIMSGIVLLYRMILLFGQVRVTVTKWKSPLADPQIISSICIRSSFSDWFLLSRLQRNLLPIHFAELVRKLKVVSQCCEERDDCDKLVANKMITTSFSTESKE